MKIINRLKYIIAALFAFVVTMISGQAPLSAYLTSHAESTAITYSNVLDDLNADSNFDETAYPAVADDYSVNLITIAEGNRNELFLYVYQPSDSVFDLRCIKVSISLGFSPDGEDLSPMLYNLELVSTNGVFDKYVVKDIVIPNEEVHYYNIVALYRVVNSFIDTSIEGGTTDGKAYSVGQQWCSYMKDGAIIYEMITFTTLKLTPILNGNVYYGDGLTLGDFVGIYKKCNAHFLAFNIDSIIVNGKERSINARHIFDADITYQYRNATVFNNGLTGSKEIRYPDGEAFSSKNVRLSDTQKHTYQGKGLFAKEYTWNRIMTTSDFIKNFEDQKGTLNKTSKEQLKNSEYVFSFVETEWKEVDADDIWGSSYEHYVEVANVTVLRLHFLDTTGKIYNLGVVCDITTADNISDGEALGIVEEWWQKLIALILFVLFVVIFWPLLAPLLGSLIKLAFTGFGKIIKFILTGVLKIATLPLRLISWLWVGKG